jgi:radical SAM superfamily enzyme YgiQ (UPF0313 family)
MRNLREVEVMLVDFNLEISPGFGVNEVIEPIGLCYIGGHLKDKFPGLEISIIQKRAKEKYDEFKKRLTREVKKREDKCLIIGFTSVMANYPYMEEWCKTNRKDNLCFIIGGTHPTGVIRTLLWKKGLNFMSCQNANPVATIQEIKCDPYLKDEVTKDIFETFDFIVTHEGEIPFAELVELIINQGDIDKIKATLRDREVKGISFAIGNDIYYWGPSERMKNFSHFPLREYLPLDQYLSWQIPPAPYDWEDPEKYRYMFSTLLSRGCNGNCDFCTNPLMWLPFTLQGKRTLIARRKLKSIISELSETLQKGIKIPESEEPVKPFYFWLHDESFTQGILKGELDEFINEMKKLRNDYPDLYFSAMGRLRDFKGDRDKRGEKLKQLREAGCWLLSIGVEFADEDRLGRVKGAPSKEEIKEIFQDIFCSGIIPVAFFILGMPIIRDSRVELETLGYLEEVKNFAKELYALRYRFTFFYPFLGTKARKQIDDLPNKEEILIRPDILKDFSKATTEEPIFKILKIKDDMSSSLEVNDLIDYRARIYHEIYTSEEFWKRFKEFVYLNIPGNRARRESMRKWIEMLGGKIRKQWEDLYIEFILRYGALASEDEITKFLKEESRDPSAVEEGDGEYELTGLKFTRNKLINLCRKFGYEWIGEEEEKLRKILEREIELFKEWRLRPAGEV